MNFFASGRREWRAWLAVDAPVTRPCVEPDEGDAQAKCLGRSTCSQRRIGWAQLRGKKASPLPDRGGRVRM